jgi:hypothetical protein
MSPKATRGPPSRSHRWSLRPTSLPVTFFTRLRQLSMTETAPKSPFTTYTFSKTCSFDRSAHENWRFFLLVEQGCGIEVEGDDEPVLVVFERRARVQSHVVSRASPHACSGCRRSAVDDNRGARSMQRRVPSA